MLLVALVGSTGLQPRAQQPYASGHTAAEIPRVLLVLLALSVSYVDPTAAFSSLWGRLLHGGNTGVKKKEPISNGGACIQLTWKVGLSWWFQTTQK